jgi:UDP-glucose 4-epimerase
VRIVVTGASGNIGTALLRRLRSADATVVGISRRVPPRTDAYADVDWVAVDLAAEDAARSLTATFAGADAVVHLAWLLQPGRDRELLRRANVGGTRAVISAAQAAGVAHLLHVSSIGTYAPAPDSRWVDESWPATGVGTSSYSVDKAAAEAMLDEVVGGPLISRVRPSFVLQDDAASEIARYFLGRLVPTRFLHPALLRIAPWPRELRLQLVHADDLAEALVRILGQRAEGAFNVASEPVVDRDTVREAVGGVGPPLPLAAVRVAAQLTWRAHLQPIDGGWIDLAAGLPLMKTDRARSVLGWQPVHRADETLLQFIRALAAGRGSAGPLLYPRGQAPPGA